MQLIELLERHVTRIGEIAEWFADRSFLERREALFALDRAGQRRLYAVAAQAEAITLADLVPATTSSPLPPPFVLPSSPLRPPFVPPSSPLPFLPP